MVELQVVGPLAARDGEQSRFSRARLPPADRRVRILDEAPQKDGHGDAFYAFAVDEKRAGASDWRLGAVVGCAYVDRGEVFVKSGEQHRPAAFLVGKSRVVADKGTCQAVAATASLGR